MEPGTIETRLKNPFASKTLWGIGLTGLSLALNVIFHLNFDKALAMQLIDFLSQNWETTIVPFILLLWSAWARIVAVTQLSTKAPMKPVKVDASERFFPLVLVFLFPVWAICGEPEVIDLEPVPVFSDGIFVEGYTTGLFPTGASNQATGDALGGGMSFGYKFHDLLGVSASGQWFYAGGVTSQQYTVDTLLFLPHGTGQVAEFQLLPDFIKVPYFAESRIYLLLGGGTQARGNKWESLLRAGVGVEMPLLEGKPYRYFVDGTWNVVGISTNTEVEPYAVVRTGVRIPF